MLDIAVIFFLVLLNGFFAMAELAVISARRVRLKLLANEGKRGASLALRLAATPGQVLSTVQIGITLIGIVAGAFGGARLARPLVAEIARIPLLAPYSEPAAFAIVVLGLGYVSLIFGELVPKTLALRSPEVIAARVAWPLYLATLIGKPIVIIFDLSTKAALRALGRRPEQKQAVTEEELKDMIVEGSESGAIHATEREMLEGVLHLADRPIGSVMTPRREIVWLDIERPADEVLVDLRACPHTEFPLSRGVIDDLVGIGNKSDALNLYLEAKPADLSSIARPPVVLHEGASILKTLDIFRKVPVKMAIVVDEYGSIQGLITQADLLAAIAGELPEDDRAEPAIVTREDGSLLIDGMISIYDAAEALGLRGLPKASFHTLAGFVLFELGRLPSEGQHVTWGGWRFEVVDVDGHRIDKILARRVAGRRGGSLTGSISG
jgi:putative hemolysin